MEETEWWYIELLLQYQGFTVGPTGFVSQMLAMMADLNRERVCHTESGRFVVIRSERSA